MLWIGILAATVLGRGFATTGLLRLGAGLLALVVLEIFVVRTFQMGLLGMCGCTSRAFWG